MVCADDLALVEADVELVEVAAVAEVADEV
jgi:hypothetical protein